MSLSVILWRLRDPAPRPREPASGRHAGTGGVELDAGTRLVKEALTNVTYLDGLARLIADVQLARARVFRTLASRGVSVSAP